MNSKQILALNLKCFRRKYHLSQEKFAEIIGSSLVYINQIENCKRNVSLEMLDKIAISLNRYDQNLEITSSSLIKYASIPYIEFQRIDERH